MGKVVELTIPTEQFALLDMFERIPDATAETVPEIEPVGAGEAACLLHDRSEAGGPWTVVGGGDAGSD